jgi:DNA-binding NarL/FixJ family response regulator
MSRHAITAHGQERPHLVHAPDLHVRVVIAHHDRSARMMLRAALGASNGIAPVATTGDGREVVELVGNHRPAVLILDTSLLSDGGTELIRTVRVESPETRVLTISVDDDDAALAALCAGSFGHLTRDIAPGDLARLIKRAAAGEAIVPRRLTAPLLDLVCQLPDTGWRPLHSRLTTREWEIVELLAAGASTRDIAERLVLSLTTVYSHVKSLLRKLGVHSRREAVVAAHRLRHEEALGEKPHQRSWTSSSRTGNPYKKAWPQREVPAASRARARARSPERQEAIRT